MCGKKRNILPTNPSKPTCKGQILPNDRNIHMGISYNNTMRFIYLTSHKLNNIAFLTISRKIFRDTISTETVKIYGHDYYGKRVQIHNTNDMLGIIDPIRSYDCKIYIFTLERKHNTPSQSDTLMSTNTCQDADNDPINRISQDYKWLTYPTEVARLLINNKQELTIWILFIILIWFLYSTAELEDTL